MAQTKAKTKKRSAPKSAKSSSKSKAKAPKSKAKSAKAKSSSTKSRSSSNGAGASKASSGKSRSNGSAAKSSNVEAVKGAVNDIGDKAKGAGKTVGKAASKAKMPLVAGGAAIAGAAGGLALAASKQGKKSALGKAVMRRPKIKVTSRDVARAAKEVGNFSAQVGEVANELQRARESADGRRRSPVEVVLQGLTTRR
jgi:hypothetical protein